jgi:nicotinate-nucleotide--dimethylbenzimidazole phosphoribosyltransferase
MMTELSQIISQIEPLNPAWLDQARERLDSLTKPRGSLGRLEDLAALYVGIRGELLPRLEKKWVVVFAADHGVVAEGVSAYPQEVTYQMVLNFLRGGAGINALARHAGDMGIGNTTPAAALTTVFTGKPAAAVTGRGTGIEETVLRHKVAVINRALALHHPSPEDPVGALAAVGGLEIAGIAGFILGTAAARRPLVLDGFIATAGALVAQALAPAVTDYLIAAHRSVEPGHQIMLDFLGLKPLLQFQMRLGEGTGAALGLSLLEAGVRVYREMATFGEAGVADQDA